MLHCSCVEITRMIISSLRAFTLYAHVMRSRYALTLYAHVMRSHYALTLCAHVMLSFHASIIAPCKHSADNGID